MNAFRISLAVLLVGCGAAPTPNAAGRTVHSTVSSGEYNLMYGDDLDQVIVLTHETREPNPRARTAPLRTFAATRSESIPGGGEAELSGSYIVDEHLAESPSTFTIYSSQAACVVASAHHVSAQFEGAETVYEGFLVSMRDCDSVVERENRRGPGMTTEYSDVRVVDGAHPELRHTP